MLGKRPLGIFGDGSKEKQDAGGISATCLPSVNFRRLFSAWRVEQRAKASGVAKAYWKQETEHPIGRGTGLSGGRSFGVDRSPYDLGLRGKFPIAFFGATFACDLVYWGTDDEFWPLMGMWVLGAGIVMAALAVVVGFTDFLGNAQIGPSPRLAPHGGQCGRVVLSIISFALRMGEGAATESFRGA
jgi:hypothetical protein